METWTEERVARLRDLASSDASIREITIELCLTKNQVIGKMHRLGLLRGKPRAKPTKPAKQAPPAMPEEFAEEATNFAVANRRAATDFGETVEYLSATSLHCSTVLDERGSDGLRLRCGAKKMNASSYCPKHARIFTPGAFLQQETTNHGRIGQR